MPLFSVSLLFSLQVEAVDAPEPLRELAIHVLSAADESEAKLKGEAIGKGRETTYENGDGETVQDTFKAIVGVQSLLDDQLLDGMEVASWLFRKGEHLVLDEAGVAARSA
jgi:hypothetical protein